MPGSSTTGSPRFQGGAPAPVTSYIAALFSLDGIVNAAIGAYEGRVDFIVSARGDPDASDPAWALQYDSEARELRPIQPEVMYEVRDAPVHVESRLRAGEQDWSLDFYAPAGYHAGPGVWPAWLVLVAGLIVTGTVASYLYGSLMRSAKLVALNDQLGRALRSRDEVLRVVAHDLRDPLNTIQLSVGVLLDHARDQAHLPSHKQVEVIHRSVERANTLIQDLLDVAKVEAGRLSIDPVPLDTSFLISEVIELHRDQVQDKELALESTDHARLPPISADHDRVLQVFSNLIGNAVKFSPPGRRITIGAEPEARQVRLSVTDEGPGIPPEQQKHLFEPFWQGPAEVRTGAGLGLSIAWGIVRAHGGRIWCKTEVGMGTTFFFTMPRAPDVATIDEGTDSTVRPSGRRDSPGRDQRLTG
jgi:signal transduction histidine kinase